MVLVLLCDRHNETEIRSHQPVRRIRVARMYAFGQLHLFLWRDHLFLGDLLQVLVQRIRSSVGYRFSDLELSHRLKFFSNIHL